MDCGAPEVIFCNDFDDDNTGIYSIANLNSDWNNPPWDNGVTEGRVSVISGSEAYSGNSLRVLYPSNGVGPDEGGAQWRLELGSSYTELYCSYKIKFQSGFDFVKGGKIPGLCGGDGLSHT